MTSTRCSLGTKQQSGWFGVIDGGATDPWEMDVSAVVEEEKSEVARWFEVRAGGPWCVNNLAMWIGGMGVTPEQVEAGQSVYTRRTLAMYDLVVLGISNRLIWRCPTRRLIDHYDCHVTPNHLDVGVGTGYFLDRCKFPSANPRVALMDANATSLSFASGRIARYDPEAYLQNVLEPVPSRIASFDSVSVNYLLHCLPGTMATKAIAFDHLKALMNSRAVLFGATLLTGGTTRGWAAKRLMSFYNRRGIFSNRCDDLESLSSELTARFHDVSVEPCGCAAVFVGTA